MSVKATVRAQYARIIDANASMSDAKQPPEGWIKTMRKALGMSVQDLADRMGIARNSIYLSENTEGKKSISIAQMEKIAEAMGGKFVYAIVPAGSVDHMIEEQARARATAAVLRSNAHMALEQQPFGTKSLKNEIERLTKEYVRNPSDLWSSE